MTPPVDRVETSPFEPGHTPGAFPLPATSSMPTGQKDETTCASELLSFQQRLLKTLLRINKCFLSLNEDLYGDVLDVLRAELDSAFGIFGYIEDDTYLVCPSLTREVWNRCHMEPKRIVFRLDELGGVLRQVISGKEVVLVNNPIPTPQGHVPIERFLGIPIVFAGKVIGVICLANKREEYNPDDVKFLEAVTTYIGPILESRLRAQRENGCRQENAKKLEVQSKQLARRNRQLECLSGLTELGEKDTSVEEILSSAAQMLANVFSDAPQVRGRIVFRGAIYGSGQFEETEHKLAAAIFVGDEYAGGVELCCPTELVEDESFLSQRLFVRELAERLSSILTRRKMYEDLITYQQQIELILETTQTGLSIMDEAENLIYVDPRRRKIYGDPANKTASKYFGCATSPDCPIREAIKKKQPVSRERIVPEEGNRPVLTTAIPFCLSDGRWYISEITIDLTERKQWEQRLIHMQKLEAVNHLAEGLAHEMNTPLQYMESNICFISEVWDELQRLLVSENENPRNSSDHESVSPELKRWLHELVRDEVPGELSRAISETREGLSRLARISSMLRDLSQVQEQELQTGDLYLTIEAALALSRHRWSSVATVTTNLEPGLPPLPLSHAALIQALIHIIHSITRAMEHKGMSGGTIDIYAKRNNENWIEIRIQNNGLQWSEELRKRIFVPFYSQHTPTEPADNSLAFAQRVIVQTHQGMIDLEPGGPDGSTVVIRLPIRHRGAQT
ncbi:MAG: GAF domain-containing protein [Thermogutta sp.]